ncbi:helix-turn-helix domain-containing protein [Nocardiopsis terrae]
MTPEDVSEYLAVPKKTVYACWKSWGLKGIRVGKHLRFRERSVEDYLTRNTVA